MENRYRLIYDLKNRMITNIRFKQGDTDSSVLEFNLIDNGLVKDITDQAITFNFLKGDETVVTQDITTGVSIIDALNGNFECILKNDALSYPGDVTCEMEFSNVGVILSTAKFNFTVEGSVGSGPLSVNYISAIESRLIVIDNAEDIRLASEIVRVDNETARVTEFTGLVDNVTTGVALDNTLKADFVTGNALDVILKDSIATGNITDTNLKEDIIIAGQNSFATEIETSRGGEVDLPTRLNKVDSSLSDKALQVDLETLKNTPLRRRLVNRISDDFITDSRLVAFEIERDTEVNRIRGYVAAKENGKLMEVAIYNSLFGKIVSTERREVPEIGEFEFALPYTILKRGTYYYTIVTNSVVAKFGINQFHGGLTTVNSFPLPTTLSSTTPIGKVPYAMIIGYDLPNLSLQEYRENHIRVYGLQALGNIPWGLNTTTFKICKSINTGDTFADLMSMPPTGGDAFYDMLIDDTENKLYILTVSLRLFVSSDLTASATWTEISCPTTTGLRHPQAVARPYGMAKLSNYIFIGEYSSTSTGEFAPDGGRILRYNITNGAWGLSKEFAGSRHIHSFSALGTVALYVSIGDAGYGNDVGIHRLTLAQIGTGAGGTDSWTKWTNVNSPYTDYYPVDFIAGDSNTFGGSPAGIYATSDRPGKHLLHAKTAGLVGSFNLSAQLFNKTDSPSTETVRSMVLDGNKNIYYWSAETTKQALYVSPPPYTQSYRLKEYPTSPQLVLMRSICSGDYIMMFNQRFKAVVFS